MIVFPAALLTSEEIVEDLNNSRIGYQTWTVDLDAGDVTVSSETDIGPRDAPLRPDTYEYWEASVLPATWEVNFGAARLVDYVGIVGTFGTERTAVLVETSTNGVDWTQFSDEVMPEDDAPLMFLDDPIVASRVRITLTGAEPPVVTVVYAGEVLAMQRSTYGGHTPITLALDTVLTSAMSKGGQFLGQHFVSLGIESDAKFSHLTADWYRENFHPFVKQARKTPYFFAWRPETFPKEVGYVWTDKPIKPSNMGKRNFMAVAWPMRGIGWE